MSALQRFIKSFRFAFRGLWLVYQHEQNFRTQIIAYIAVLTLATVLRVRPWELIALVLAGGFVLVLECLNSAVERLLDLVQPRLHEYVREIKDIMAAAVLIASVSAFLVGIAVLLPHFYGG